MRDIEEAFLLAVERGEVASLRHLLAGREDSGLDVNIRDPLDRDALVIAIENKNLEIVAILLESDIRVGDALLYAIQNNFVEAVELLLDHHSSSADQQQQQLLTHAGNDIYSEQSCFFSCDMTPLMLAAQKNNLEIIKLLLDRNVSPIPNPDDPRCGCEACCKARNNDCLKHSRSRINAYKALSSPGLMALSSPDPLVSAFQMSAKLEDLAKMEPEYKEEYMRLRAKCQAFATKLLDYTRTSQELEILLDFDGHLGPNAAIAARHCQLTPNVGINNYTATQFSYRSSEALQPNGGDSGRRRGRPDKRRLARLKLAIQCKQKTFCAHPNIQELLASMWYENLPGFRRMNAFNQTLQVVCIGLMFPIYSLAYLLAPHTQFGSHIKKPFIKFICHSASYMTFITVLILASQRVEAFYEWSAVMSLFLSDQNLPFNLGGGANLSSQQQVDAAASSATLSSTTSTTTSSPLLTSAYDDHHDLEHSKNNTARGLDSLSKIFEELPASSKKRGTLPSPIESVILIWVLSLLWAELKQIKTLGLNYYKDDMWNILDSIASGCYIGTIALRLVSYMQSDERSIEVAREHWHAYDPTLLSEGLFATATIFSALKLVYIFSVNPYLGPLQISLGRMIIDILRFSWIYMLVLFAFACGMNQLLWYYADLERHQCPNLADESCRTWRQFANVFESSQTLFWANFGLVDLENFDLAGIRQYTRFWALLMFGCYCFINVIVVLNLLIAMMNHSYVKISKRSDIEWKFARTRLWVSYFENGSTVPAPFNIIPSLKSLGHCLNSLYAKLCNSHKLHSLDVETLELSSKSATNYQIVMGSLVRRYLVGEQRQSNRCLTEAKLRRWSRTTTTTN